MKSLLKPTKFTFLTIFFVCLSLNAKSIDIFIGYTDQKPGPLLANGEIIQEITSSLMRPCSANMVHACGWQVRTMTPLVFEKYNHVLRLFSSAFTLRDDLNRHVHANRQLELSGAVERQYISSLRSTDMVLYVGHSRFGFGPDFFPSRITPQDLVNRSYYLNERQLVRDNLIKYFPQIPTLINMVNSSEVGFFSCDSSERLVDRIKTRYPRTQFFGTTRPLLPLEAASSAVLAIENKLN